MTPTCSACGSGPITDGICERCGFASGEQNRCPHCGAVARIEPRGTGPAAHWVCGVCGGPRTPGGLGGDRAAEPLRHAKAHRARAIRSRAASVVLGVMTAFTTLVALAAWPAALTAKLILLAVAITPAIFAMRARAKASAATAEAEAEMEKAWLAAAEDVAERASHGVTAAELAKRLKIDAAKAERLLTQLATHERTRIDVDDDAEVRYSVGPGRVRVSTDDDPLARAIEEAAAASERIDQEEAKAKTK
ncbi:MAG: hypothetical protein JST00_37250 [Deltaproteobacteria bacterium]|nr:hypothetical protein [Deltaproteobacteria bacterium]